MELDLFRARWKAASADISLEKFEDEYVALDMALGRYFALSPAGSLVLDALLGGASPAMISAANSGRQDEICALVDRLAETRILAAGSDVPVELDTAQRALIETLAGPIELESHDDLADLIMADPIHDTDGEFGWPVRKVDS